MLDNISRLMGCLRECNTGIKWVMLHTAPGEGGSVPGRSPQRLSQGAPQGGASRGGGGGA